jgi:type II secretory pathway predicted ATPase ExeA
MVMTDLQALFGFHKTPFTRELSDNEFFPLTHIDEVLQGLFVAMEERMSAAIIAPAGAGKTALLRALRARLPEARYRVRYVKVTKLGNRDMCREISAACGMNPAGNYPALVRSLQEHFENSLESGGLRPVLLLDEAHDLRPETLAMLRILTNFDMDSRLVLSVVLAGQPGLAKMLKRDELQSVAGRMAHFALLRLLSRDETKKYLEHRSAVAGAADFPFDKGACESIYELTRGNLRAIDALALKALWKAAASDDTVVASAHVVAARKELP